MKPEEKQLVDYTAGKSLIKNPPEAPIIIQETSWLKLSLIFIVIILVAVGSAIAVVSFIETPPFITNYICGDVINESLIIGFKEGVRYTSNYVLETSTIPIFLENGSVQSINIMERPNG